MVVVLTRYLQCGGCKVVSVVVGVLESEKVRAVCIKPAEKLVAGSLGQQ